MYALWMLATGLQSGNSGEQWLVHGELWLTLTKELRLVYVKLWLMLARELQPGNSGELRLRLRLH